MKKQSTLRKVAALLLAAGMMIGMVGTSVSAEAADAAWTPESTVNIILPSSAGGSTDLIARIWAKYAAELWGQPVIVTNVTGANGAVGDEQVKNAEADGYTVCFHHQAIITNNLSGLADFSYDAYKMGPNFAEDPTFCIFTQAAKYADLNALTEAAKEAPGGLKAGAAVGGYAALMASAFADAAGIELQFVDLGDNAENTAGLLGGHIDCMPSLYGTNASYVESGDFAVLGVANDERVSLYPDVPTFKEQGLDFSFSGYQFGFLMPAETSDEIVEAFCSVTEQILSSEEAVAELAAIGAIPAFRNGEDNTVYWQGMEETIQKYWE